MFILCTIDIFSFGVLFIEKTIMSLNSTLKVILLVAVICLMLISCEAKKKKLRKSSKGMLLRQKETNPINFIRLSAMRLIYGLAVRMGMGEQISDALGGIFVPPGAEDYDEDYLDF